MLQKGKKLFFQNLNPHSNKQFSLWLLYMLGMLSDSDQAGSASKIGALQITN